MTTPTTNNSQLSLLFCFSSNDITITPHILSPNASQLPPWIKFWIYLVSNLMFEYYGIKQKKEHFWFEIFFPGHNIFFFEGESIQIWPLHGNNNQEMA
jgi:hypothetical protein